MLGWDLTKILVQSFLNTATKYRKGLETKFFKMTVIDNQEKSDSYWTLNYDVICLILKLGGLNQPPPPEGHRVKTVLNKFKYYGSCSFLLIYTLSYKLR